MDAFGIVIIVLLGIKFVALVGFGLTAIELAFRKGA
jgi:hypothetical protein